MRVFPVGDPADADEFAITDDADWTAVHGLAGSDEGIVDDTTGTALQLTSGPDGNSVVIAPGRFRIRGRACEITAPITLAIATGVTAGNARVDAIVARYDASASDPHERVTIMVKAGTVASAAAAVAPALTRTGDVWEWQIGTATRSGAESITDSKLADTRLWAVRLVMGEGTPQLLASDPIGTVKLVGGEWYQRRALAGGPTWIGGKPAAKAKLASAVPIKVNVVNTVTAALALTTSPGHLLGGMSAGAASLQVPVTGLYRVDASLRIKLPALGDSESAELQTHITAGSVLRRVGRVVLSGPSSLGRSLTVDASTTEILSAGDAIDVRFLSSRAGVEIDPVSVNTYLSVIFERAA